jgi:hypothetical protein
MYVVKCQSISKCNQANVNKYIKLDLQYQELNNKVDEAKNPWEEERIERQLADVWERQQDVGDELPDNEKRRAEVAMTKVRGY